MKRITRSLVRNHSLPYLAVATFAIGAIALSAPAARAQQFELTDEQFDQWVFRGNHKQRSADEEITVAVDSVDGLCHLTEAQQEKLRLAGRGDFARFQQRADELRAEYAGKTYDQNELGQIFQKLQPLMTTYQSGLLGRSSLFAKVLHNTLTPEQLADYEGADAERLKQRYAAKVRLLIAVDGKNCALTDDQRSALVDLLLAETRPPKRSSEYDWYVVLAQASRIPDAKFRAILDDAQMRWWKKSMERAGGMEGFLKQQDLLVEP